MSLESLILTYGYPLLFVGVLIEGEAMLILGAYLAHRGYFSLPVVIGIAGLASFLIAQGYFWLGRRYGSTFLAKRPDWQERFVRVETLFHRYGAGLIVGFRGLYGLRGVIPAAIGLSTYPGTRFTVFNGLGALIWALLFGLAGNALTRFGELIIGDLRRHEELILVIMLVLGAVWGLYRLYRQPRLQSPPGSDKLPGPEKFPTVL